MLFLFYISIAVSSLVFLYFVGIVLFSLTHPTELHLIFIPMFLLALIIALILQTIISCIILVSDKYVDRKEKIKKQTKASCICVFISFVMFMLCFIEPVQKVFFMLNSFILGR